MEQQQRELTEYAEPETTARGGAWAWLVSRHALFVLSVLMLAAFAAFFYAAWKYKNAADNLRVLSIDVERILNANDATATAVRLAASLKSASYLLTYEDQLKTRAILQRDCLKAVTNEEARQAFKEMADLEVGIVVDEHRAIILMEQEKWGEALEIVISPYYKREKALYRAALSRALLPLLAESEQNAIVSQRLSTAMQALALAVFLAYAVLGRIYANRMGSALATEQRLRMSLKEANAFLEQRVVERTAEVTRKAEELGKAYGIIADSITYASRIQRAVLPEAEVLAARLPQHLALWRPRDVVGGDIYWARPWGDGLLLILGDCTGHGVPGAFMTLIATGALDMALRRTPPGDPAALLTQMHQRVQRQLGQDCDDNGSGEGGSHGRCSDDGLEAGACYIPADNGSVTFSGARFSLFVQDGPEVAVIKGTGASMGYRGIAPEPGYANHTVSAAPGRRFFLTSDGLLDQVGEESGRAFGKRRFQALLAGQPQMPLEDLGDLLFATVEAFRGSEVRLDDIAVLGFELKP
ncbi:MAG: serine/threonine-protein phosphatase [Proteobacteria bacterium]|nr:serine/threonine-protein phosphatase [Pseudomonadota bacterium]